MALSTSERQFVVEGVALNKRNDGRENTDYRHILLETGVLHQTNGSARLKLGNATDVLVGVKLETGQPDPETPNKGKVHFSVEWYSNILACTPDSFSTPLASPEFEGRGAEAVNAELASVLQRLMVLDLEQLCILPGKLCWVLWVDALVLDYGGNLIDAIFLAAVAALHNTQIPLLQVNEELGEFDVSDDPEDYKKLDIQNVPICVTFTKIGSSYVVDATPEEELCMSMRLTIAMNRKGNLCALQKGGHGGLDPSSVNEMIHTARKLALHLREKLDQALEKESQSRKPTVGFFV